MKAPIAKRIPFKHTIHNDVREDDYYWMKERTDPEVVSYLEEENKYTNEIMRPLEQKTNEIFESMVARVPEAEEKVPVQNGPYFYYSRQQKDKQYAIYARKKAAGREQLTEAEEEVLLDLNVLAGSDDYLSVTQQRLNEKQTKLAYLENRDGSDRYTLYIKDLTTGDLLNDKIENVYIYGSIEWSRCGRYMFYVTVDDMQRPYRLWRHEIGGAESDELLFEEKEVTFALFISKTQSGNYITVQSSSTMTEEVRLINADEPLAPVELVDERRRGIKYEVEHWGDHLLILTNEDALNFKLLRCSVSDFSEREEVIPYDENRYLQAIYPTKDKLFLFGRENGLTQIWMLENEELQQLDWPEPLYTLSIVGGQSYEAEELLIEYESLLTQDTTYSLELTTGDKQVIHTATVNGEYNPESYNQHQLWATARDGVKVPLMVTYKKGALDNGPAPLILTGYGSYGADSNPYFNAYRLPLLDKGIVFVTAQVRGGGEMGRHWYENGKMRHKLNTFTDFIDAAKFLIEEGYTSSEKIAARGGSAGGLLVGAVSNMASDLFKVIVPEVPFVDVLTTMLDDTIPLTTLEWDEWGNPQNEGDYTYMKSYSPYDNVEEKDYPHMYITTGLNDPRVAYWEPAKWAARLCTMKTDDNTLVLKTNMGAGHFGASGRFDHLKEASEVYAFILDKLGVE
ncbi:S9 family peptidase [Jeotgalibacillus proteolyticus]|uniref:Oligopeptidase B n=1 Tax=Jeotgalibacillus proteolyticus TaxID=2082395 RepID=A0A2S5GDC5_9BACL|nr:S9 family peptidase [Jeotgalibacillus proteolyticus]PPA71042.1 oligopeptidase B [Jeotgalibacillus proteolyticus]